jgi:hypothetical protein
LQNLFDNPRPRHAIPNHNQAFAVDVGHYLRSFPPFRRSGDGGGNTVSCIEGG